MNTLFFFSLAMQQSGNKRRGRYRESSTRGDPMSEINNASSSGTPSRATLGLTGLTINAMALIAPGAFLWLTFQIQALYGAPMAGGTMWFGIVAALLLCFATAISYA
jgi:hypothetical protein